MSACNCVGPCFCGTAYVSSDHMHSFDYQRGYPGLQQGGMPIPDGWQLMPGSLPAWKITTTNTTANIEKDEQMALTTACSALYEVYVVDDNENILGPYTRIASSEESAKIAVITRDLILGEEYEADSNFAAFDFLIRCVGYVRGRSVVGGE